MASKHYNSQTWVLKSISKTKHQSLMFGFGLFIRVIVHSGFWLIHILDSISSVTFLYGHKWCIRILFTKWPKKSWSTWKTSKAEYISIFTILSLLEVYDRHSVVLFSKEKLKENKPVSTYTSTPLPLFLHYPVRFVQNYRIFHAVACSHFDLWLPITIISFKF